jgi:hypothetical protein
MFEAERTVLAEIFPPSAFRIEHVGSTAVPGIPAKPIVDILVGAGSLTARFGDDREASTDAKATFNRAALQKAPK